MSLLAEFDPKRFDKVQRKEDVIDKYEDKLGTYLVKLTAVELQRGQNNQVSLILHTISDFERIGDHAVNIAEVAQEISDKKLEFSHEATRELKVIRKAVLDILDLTLYAYTENDMEKAYQVEPLEEVIDTLCYELKARHISRVQSGNCTLNQGFVFNDLLGNYERIADYCSNIAVAMIELQSAEFDTHEYLNSVKEHDNPNFIKLYEEYKLKYVI